MFSSTTLLKLYSGIATASLAAIAAQGGTASFEELDVERINVREADGTLRMTLSNRERIPQIVTRDGEWPHPNRDGAGMIFFNDEGTEMGGLVFAGHEREGRRYAYGSLTFDRYGQDQTVQMLEVESGGQRTKGFNLYDRPDLPIDWDKTIAAMKMEDPQARSAAIEAANATGTHRAFFGGDQDRNAVLWMRDLNGNKRLAIQVTPEGEAAIIFIDADGTETRRITGTAD